jgi:hypothetical protein
LYLTLCIPCRMSTLHSEVGEWVEKTTVDKAVQLQSETVGAWAATLGYCLDEGEPAQPPGSLGGVGGLRYLTGGACR